MTNPSHYFDSVEKYLSLARGSKNMQTLRDLIEKDGCPAELIDQIQAGALVDFIFELMPNINDNIRVYDPNGVGIKEEKKLYSIEEWGQLLCMTFVGMSSEYAQSLLTYMLNKGYICEENHEGSVRVFRQMAPLRRKTVKL